jgi:hypothetical protein
MRKIRKEAYLAFLLFHHLHFQGREDVEPYDPLWSDPVFAMPNKGLRVDKLGRSGR